MAPFNPQINPLNPQDYGSKSRPVDIDQGIKPQGVAQNQIMPHGVMQGDESAKYAGEAQASEIKSQAVGDSAMADLFKDITGTVDFLGKAGVHMVKKDIENKVYEVADRERQSYTDLLEKIKAGSGVKNVLESPAEGSDAGGPDTPSEVAGLPGTLESLQGAKDSGKISGAYYQSKLLSEAKKLRAQHPGFREDIDQAFSKVTGSIPANAYIHSLVTDINRAATSQATQKNNMLHFIRSNMDTIPNAPQVYHDYDKGLISDEQVIAKAYPYQKTKADLQMNNLIFNDVKNTREDRQRIAGLGIDKAAGMVVNQAVDTITSKMGLNSGEDLDRLISAQSSGQIPAPVWQQYGQTISNTITQLTAKMTADADAHGYTQAIGGKAELNKRIGEAIKPLIDLRDRVYNRDFGGIYDTKNQLTAMNDETQKSLLTDKKIGPYWQQVKAVKDIGGEQNLQKFNLDTIKGDFNNDYRAYFSRVQKEFAGQSTMKTSGVPYTFNDTIDNLKANKVSDGKFNDAVLNEVKRIHDKSIPEAIRMNYAMAAFSPGNRGMISRLQDDGTDAKGRKVTGQTAVFQRFTSPEMTSAMYDLGKKNPEVWQQYTTWAKETLSNELMSKEIHDLAKIDPSVGNISVGWDSKNHRFMAVDTMSPEARASQTRARGGPATADSANSYYNLVNSSVNRLNGNLTNYKEIAKVTGEDPDAFVLKSIADAAGPEILRNVQGIPHQIMRDIGLSKLTGGHQ